MAELADALNALERAGSTEPVEVYVAERNNSYRRRIFQILGEDVHMPPKTLVMPIQDIASLDALPVFYGGAVFHPVIGNKGLLKKPYAHDPSVIPPYWTDQIAQDMEGTSDTEGYVVFDQESALDMAMQMIARHGRVRLKSTVHSSGEGQATINSLAGFQNYLNNNPLLLKSMANAGLVLEQHLDRIVSLSVGLERFGDRQIATLGMIRERPFRDNPQEYEGTDMIAAAHIEDLQALGLDPVINSGLSKALQYFAAMERHFEAKGLAKLPRKNVDVLIGYDGTGQRVVEVADPSFRPGGASGASILALESIVGGARFVSASTFYDYLEEHPQSMTNPEWVMADCDDPQFGRVLAAAHRHMVVSSADVDVKSLANGRLTSLLHLS